MLAVALVRVRSSRQPRVARYAFEMASNSTNRWALISVSDKTGVVDLAQQLSTLGFRILSTGGTAKMLAASGVEVTEVAQYTGFPEMLDGRVKLVGVEPWWSGHLVQIVRAISVITR